MAAKSPRRSGVPIDDTTRAILSQLRKNARMTYKEIAAKIGRPESTVRDRIRRLEAEGIIRGYTIFVDRTKLGLSCSALVLAAVENDRIADVTRELLSMSNVLQVHHTSGAKRLAILVAARDFEGLQQFLSTGLAKLRLKDEEVIVLLKSFREYAGPLEF